MINSVNIGSYIKSPESIPGDSVEDFKKIIELYPYCSTAYLLHLKSLSQSNNLHFDEHLKLAAAHVMDGEKLYHLIHSEEISEIPETPVEKEETNETSDKSTIKVDSIEKNETITSPLEVDILSHAVEAAYDLTAHETTEEPTIDAAKDSEKEKSETVQKEIVEPVEIAKLKVESKIDTSNFTFIEWLKHKQNTQESTPTDKIDHTDTGSLEPLRESISDSKKMSKKEINALLDKFISEEPRISVPRKEIFDSNKNAKRSLEETRSNVTETLAKIHLMQKNYSKAISAYEQLILLYPEKKTFFANQIKKIKDENNI